MEIPRSFPRKRRLCAAFLFSLALAVSTPAQSIRILSLTFEGNKSIDADSLRRALRLSMEAHRYLPEGLQSGLQALETLYRNEGFFLARLGPPAVELKEIPGGSQAAAIRIPVKEGPIFTVREILVKNAQALRPSTLLEMCPLRRGQPYSRKKISDWQEKIAEGYHAMGHIRFQSDVQENVHESLHVVDLTLECREGSAYSVGKISIEGAASIDPLDFKRQLLVGEGGLFNPDMLALSIQFLNLMRKYKTITSSDVETIIDDAAGTVNLVFHIDLLK